MEKKMDTTKRNRIIYWVLTIVLMVPGAGGGLVELFTNGPESIVKTMQLLGYPLYLMKILGFAKVLGGLAILTGKIPRLKEWAYAGFAINFLGATASHVLADDSGFVAQTPTPDAATPQQAPPPLWGARVA